MFENFPKSQNEELSEKESLDVDLTEENLTEEINSKNEEINLKNLEVSDLRKIEEILLLREEILGTSYKASEKYHTELTNFLKDVESAYPEDDLEKIALIHILKGTEIPEDAEMLDLEGEYSVEAFLKELQSEIEEHRI